MQKRTLVFSPDTGREKIPEAVKAKTRERLLKYARKDFSGKYTELESGFEHSSATSMRSLKSATPDR